MISTLINTRILKNTTYRIPLFLFRSKTNEARSPNETTVMDHEDMPISGKTFENPYKKERQICILCKLNIDPDYKNVRLLSQFQSRYTGRIYGKHITGLCDRKQKRVEEEIMKAQTSGLMGYMTKDPKFVNDPMLFNPDTPLRPHKY